MEVNNRRNGRRRRLLKRIRERKSKLSVEQPIQGLRDQLVVLGQLAAGLAHEINNPLQSIQAHLDLLLDYDLKPNQERRYLQIIQDEMARLSQISQQMLKMAQPPASKRRNSVLLRSYAVGEMVCILYHGDTEITEFSIKFSVFSVPLW